MQQRESIVENRLIKMYFQNFSLMAFFMIFYKLLTAGYRKVSLQVNQRFIYIEVVSMLQEWNKNEKIQIWSKSKGKESFFKTYLAIFSDMHIISNECVKRKSFERQSNYSQIWGSSKVHLYNHWDISWASAMEP